MATSTLGSGTLVLAGTTSGTTTVTATAVAGTTTLTLPAATDTLVGKATTDTLTNKTLTAPTLASANITTALTLTGASGTNGQALTSGGSGNAPTWTTIGATPGGSTTQVQYNNAGAFAGISGVTTDGTRMTASTTIGVGAATPSTSGAGITFPATQSASSNANTLDDYEEGIWTPVAARYTGGSITAVYGGSNAGKYTRIGRLVTIECFLEITSVSSQGSSLSQITGLPVLPPTSYLGTGAVFYNTAATTINIVSGSVNSGDACIYFHESGNNATLASFAWTAGSLNITISYSI